MSLRARLLTVLVGLAALGLVTVAAVVYAEQRSFLLDRLDSQVTAAVPGLSRALDTGTTDAPGPGPARGPGGGPGDGGGGGGPGPFRFPPGTYGERRNLSGKTIATVVSSYGTTAPSPPKLPKQIPIGHKITVKSKDGSLSYRVLALPEHDGPNIDIAAVPQTEVDQTLSRLVRVEGLVIAGVLLALAALAWWLVRVGLRPLDRMGETAGAIAAGDLSRRVSPADRRTEVGRLGLSLNAMLHQIERAFAEREASENRLRRFLADASHELRTPLASIRGYAEVFRMGAAKDPADTEKAMSRIEDESARMGALVEDLLTLARLDQLPETARKPVNLTELAHDAVDDARAAAPEREVELVRADGDVTVLGDSSQLRQVIGNLVRNALVHTPPRTPIELHVFAEGGEGVLQVRDHGDGLPTGDTEAMFERFWRSDPGRGRGPAGAGLGLSIVAAVVDAHGGHVSAANAPDGGAVFTVRLPGNAQ